MESLKFKAVLNIKGSLKMMLREIKRSKNKTMKQNVHPRKICGYFQGAQKSLEKQFVEDMIECISCRDLYHEACTDYGDRGHNRSEVCR